MGIKAYSGSDSSLTSLIKGMMSKLTLLLITFSLNVLNTKFVPQFPFRTERELKGYINGHGHHALNNHVDEVHDAHDDVEAGVKALAVQDNLRVNGTLQDDGRICVQKLMNVQEKVFEEMMVCDHKSEKSCHDTYKTVYVPHQVKLIFQLYFSMFSLLIFFVQEEECEEKFQKRCVISYEDKAENAQVEECRAQFVPNCEERTPKDCRVVYDTECSTRQKVHDVEDEVASCNTIYETGDCETVFTGRLLQQNYFTNYIQLLSHGSC